MKKILLLITFFCLNFIYAQGPTCDEATAFCAGGTTLTFGNSTNVPNIGGIDCLGSAPNPAWFYMTISQSGNLNFLLTQGNNAPNYDNLDVDFVVWGPFSGPSCTNLYDYPVGNTSIPDNVIDCSYSASPTENVDIPGAIAGQVYMVLITNYSNQPGQITLTQTNLGAAGAGATDCNVVCGVTLGPDEYICSTSINCYPITATFLAPSTQPGTPLYTWYLDIGDGNGPILQPAFTTASITVCQSGTWSVLATRPGCTAPSSDDIIISFSAPPALNTPPDLTDPSGSCNPTFDLTSNLAIILGSLDPTQYVITYSTNFGGTIINTPDAYTTNTTETIYVDVVSINNSTCAGQVEFLVIVNCTATATMPPDMVVCDDITQNGTEIFDLTTQDALILNGLDPTEYTITYHLTQADADNDVGAIATPTAFSGGPNQIIYVRMESNITSTVYSTTSFHLIVNPLPTAAIGTSTICSGQTATVTITGTPGATVNYLDGLGAAQSVVLNAAGTAVVTTPVLTANSTYSLVDVTSNTTPACTRAVNGTATVTVNPLPTATITANTICSGTTGTVTITGTPGATVHYTVDSGANQTVVLDASGNATLTSPILTSDSIYCLVDVTSNTTPACTQTVSDCAAITVIPLPTAAITANTVCSGTSGTVTITGTSNATVHYTVDGGAQQTVVLDASGNATITSPALTVNSTYCLVDVVSNTTPACTQALTACATITILPLPTASITANTVCEGTTGTVTITGTPNATVQYTVDGGANQSALIDASGTVTITSPVLASNSTYCLVDVTSNSTPACTTVVTACATIIVNPLPTVAISASSLSFCEGTSTTINFTGTPDATITYTIGGASNTILLDASGNASVTASATSTYCLVNAASNSTPVCNQAFTDCVTVTMIPLPTATIAGSTVCLGTPSTLTFTGTPGATVNYNLGATPQTAVVLDATGSATVTATNPVGTFTYTIVDVTSATTPPCTAPIAGQTATVEVLDAPVINPVSDIRVCDDDNNGIATFDLTPAVTQAQGGDLTLIVTIHPTLADAQNDSNALTPAQVLAFTNNALNSQVLHIRIENAGSCYSTNTFTVFVDPRPALNQNVTDYELCDVTAPAADGIEVFDLTNATTTASITNGAAGLTLSYYTSLADAQVPQNAIGTPTAYSNTTPNQQTIWVVAENAAGCRHITSFDLIVNPLPPITPLAPMNGCSDGINPNSASFNLIFNDTIVTNGQPGFTVTYHLTQNDADNDVLPLASPYNSISNPQIIFVRVENATTGCYDTTTLQLNVTQGPTANQPTNLAYCDPDNDGYGEFDLQSTLVQISGGATPAGVTVTFHETQADAMQVPPANPILATPYLNNVQNVQTIYVAVSYASTGCTNYTQFDVVVNPTPVLVIPDPLQECDDATADGLTQFNLTQANAQIIGANDPATVQISYHLTDADAQAGTPSISNILSYTNTTPNQQTIYVRVEFIATGCFKVVPLDLIVNPRPTMPTPESIVLTLCDNDNSGDQQEFFDLTGHIPNIVGTQTNMLVTFHLTQAQALAGTNQLTSPYQNTSNTQSIFVRVENGQTGCFDVVILDLRVEPLPILLMPDAAVTTLCDEDASGDGFSTFDLTALEFNMLNGAPNVTVSFYETPPTANANPPVLPIPNPSAYMNIDPFMQVIYVLATNTLTGCTNLYPLTLTVHAAPVMPTDPVLPDLTECDTNFDGVRVFDLTVQNAAILAVNPTIPATPSPIRYYQTLTDAMNGTAAIVTPTTYTNQSNPQTIWVVITDAVTGCSAMDSFDLIVNVPVNGLSQELSVCDDGPTNDQVTTFDLTQLNTGILNGSPVGAGATFVYYTSQADAQAGTNAIATPTAFTNTVNPQNIWVVITTVDGCTSITLAKVRVIPSPTPFMNPIALETCDDDQTIIGSELFDVTQNQTIIQNGFVGLVFEYYPTLADAEAGTNMIPDATAYLGGDATATPPTNIVYIKVKNAYTDSNGQNCYKIVEQELIVNPLPIVDVTDFVNCDDDNDGIAEFTLSNYNEDLLGTTQPVADFTVTYYDTQANAQNVTSTIGLLPNVYTNTVNNELIYPRIVNNLTGCINSSATVTLIVKEAAIANIISQTTLDLFTVCDEDGTNNGFTVFDLTIVEAEVYGAQTTPPVLITYHTNSDDADNGVGAIVNPSAYLNTSNPQTIFIRVTRDNTVPGDTSETCYVVSSQTIELNVELLAEPVITSDTGYDIICVDYNSGLLISGLTLDSGIPAGSGYTYQWALNGTDITDGTGTDATYIVDTVAPGVYTVVVTSTSPQGCVSIITPESTFEVIQSGPAANLESFINGSFEETQTITITNDGYGTYEYQLDGEGPWQSSPVFTNVPAGEHFVIVRDATNPDYRCDEVRIDDVSIINYPHFFTPNGDGINDNWNITGLSSQETAKIYIFDRYGKLLKQISSTSPGWDGTFNGQPLPATDYWFTVDYYEITPLGVLVPKQFKAHFSLKR